MCPLNTGFTVSESTLDSPESVFTVFRRRPSLDAPDINYKSITAYLITIQEKNKLFT